MMMYVQDYDETYPYIRFHGDGAGRGTNTLIWKNVLRPYVKSIDVYSCPSNPYSHPIAGMPGTDPVTAVGMNGEGWEVEPEQRMPISYVMNSCASTWYAADTAQGRANPPIRAAQLTRPAETIMIAECKTSWADMNGIPAMWTQCYSVFSHPTGKVGIFIYHDGHVQAKKWLSTLYPLNQNQWILNPNPDPNNHKVIGPDGCQAIAPASPSDKVFQSPACLAYQ
jgi:hypothetical protein